MATGRQPGSSNSGRDGDLIRAAILQETPPASAVSFPSQIGKFRLLRQIGRGGMGVVFEAEQDKPRRRVALKLIRSRLGVNLADMRKRFDLEASALARLQHPGIAQMFEAGVVDDLEEPYPYFAMELIEGESLLLFAETAKLSIEQRFELIVSIADAVHHAHQKGVIHRDLKPDNVLINAERQPKVVDFGVARITDADLNVTETLTREGNIIGTLAYMSPEQASGAAANIDTRTDIYALGVTAYQLLSGRLPYDFTSKTALAAIKEICEGEPARLATIDRRFRGDIDAIISKALSREPERRYASAAEFASDIRRYLSDQPVSARPPSGLYQIRKFAKRNKATVTSIALGSLSLVLLLGFLAVYSQLESQHLLEDKRQLEADIIDEILKPDSEPLRARIERASRVPGFEEYVGELISNENRSSTSRLVQLASADNVEMNREQFQKLATAIEARMSTSEPETRLERYQRLESLATGWRLHDLAAQYAQKELELVRATGRDVEQTVRITLDLASSYANQGQFDDAISLAESILEQYEHQLGTNHPLMLRANRDLGAYYQYDDRFEDALAVLQQVYSVQVESGAEDIELAYTLNELGQAEAYMGLNKDAEPHLAEALAIFEAELGPTHVDTQIVRSNYAVSISNNGKSSDALHQQELARDTIREVLGSDSGQLLKPTWAVLQLLNLEFMKTGESDPRREALADDCVRLAVQHWSTDPVLATMAMQQACGAFSSLELEDKLNLALANAVTVAATTKEDCPDCYAATLDNLAHQHYQDSAFDLAAFYYAQRLEFNRSVFDATDPRIATDMITTATALVDAGRPEQALKIAREALTLRQLIMPDDAFKLAVAEAVIAGANLKLEHNEETRSTLASKRSIVAQRLGNEHWFTQALDRWLSIEE